MHVHTTGNNNVTTKIAAEFLVGGVHIRRIWTDDVEIFRCEHHEFNGGDTFKEYEQMTLESSGVSTMNSTGDDTFKEYEQMTLESSGVNTMNSTGDDTFKEHEQMTLESSGVITMNSTGDDTFTEYEQMTLKSSGVNTMNSTGDKKRRCRCSRWLFRW